MTSWERAQIEADQGGPITDAERVVWLSEGDPHRVVFVLNGATLRARCSCDGWHYRDWCAHVGVREYARKTGRAPGTVGNLLARAREKARPPTPHAGGGEA
ncbi:MAG: hypothetical protein BRD21_01820 [Halobacteriales archaeon SW_8_66_22]|nr:MAG: hypothetical protein BRD21_01820 [Halobacteriales archaeon SW_8_66_22]